MKAPPLDPAEVTWRKADSGEALEASSLLLDYEKSKFEVAEFTAPGGLRVRVTCCVEPVGYKDIQNGRLPRDANLGRLTIMRKSGDESIFFRGRTDDQCKRVGLGLWYGYLLGHQLLDAPKEEAETPGGISASK